MCRLVLFLWQIPSAHDSYLVEEGNLSSLGLGQHGVEFCKGHEMINGPPAFGVKTMHTTSVYMHKMLGLKKLALMAMSSS